MNEGMSHVESARTAFGLREEQVQRLLGETGLGMCKRKQGGAELKAGEERRRAKQDSLLSERPRASAVPQTEEEGFEPWRDLIVV